MSMHSSRRRTPNRRPPPNPTSPDDQDQHMQDVFRRHFEARFQPLPAREAAEHDVSDRMDTGGGASADEEDEWSGCSSSGGVEIVSHADDAPAALGAPADRRELRAFMSSKPPASLAAAPAPAKARPDDPAADEAQNLKNDAALQRLLAESHLLSEAAAAPGAHASSASLELAGKARHRALALRMRTLASGGSSSSAAAAAAAAVEADGAAGGTMPMAMRRGIDRRRREREDRRRREAREAGVVLEAPAAGKRGRGVARGRRERGGVGDAAVGRFKRGLLTLSNRDVAQITGKRGGRRGGGRRR